MIVDAKLAWTIFLATLPILLALLGLLGTIIWNLVKLDKLTDLCHSIDKRLAVVESRIGIAPLVTK